MAADLVDCLFRFDTDMCSHDLCNELFSEYDHAVEGVACPVFLFGAWEERVLSFPGWTPTTKESTLFSGPRPSHVFR